ncbi:MATE family efflux transporter [Parvimonas sp. D2]|uniref:MATE family efflux transporter n=1 Tax=unclassified Parvimonas TaxID=1151464 RepID=UPI002B49D663|nr:MULTISPECIES: MATE family efflux transporter [unclassified Parvimonas]MEB3012008.1 MATE family efflux transporter [Parvimonas sp. D2]MEB3087559.1 MATE family efflux transporter [Parvimonas sp. D4]
MKNKRLELNKFAFPLMVNFILSYILELSDIAIVARVSTPAFNAVNLISSTLYTISGVLGATAIIINTKLGEKLGQGDEKGLNYEFFSSLAINIFMGILFLLLMLLGKTYFLKIFYNLSGETLEQGILFSYPMSFCVLLQLCLFTFGAYFRISNMTKWILIGSTVSSVLNLGLDYLFVLGKFGFPKFGITMVGFSTVFSMFVNLLIYIFVLKNKLNLKFELLKSYFINGINHFKLAFPIMIQEIFDGTIFVIIFNMIVIRIGNNEFAGYSIITNLIMFLFTFKHIYGSATLSLISISSGEKNIRNLIDYPKISVKITTVLFIFGSALFVIFREYLPKLITDDVSVQNIATKFLIFFLIANICSSYSYIYKCALQGLNKNMFLLKTTAGVNIISLILMLILTQVFDLSLFGVAFSQFVNEFILSVIFLKYYRYIVNDKFYNLTKD